MCIQIISAVACQPHQPHQPHQPPNPTNLTIPAASPDISTVKSYLRSNLTADPHSIPSGGSKGGWPPF